MMAPVVEVSRPAVPAEAFERFRGRWVAISDGHIVADAATLETLDGDERVSLDDTRFKVPVEGAKFL
jgi:hypothetical protein